MNRWKLNRFLWCSMGLVMLLCMAIVVYSTGTTYARYRTEREEKITFEVREAERVALGTMKPVVPEETEGTGQEAPASVFTQTDTLIWETVNDKAYLNFTVANGATETSFSENDQTIKIRIIGTLGLWTGMETVKLYLQIPSATDPEQTEIIQAAVAPIAEGSALYHTHGPGWIYSFLNAEEEELTWTLTGGAFSSVDLTIFMDGPAPQEDAALQPLIIAEAITG